MVLQFKCASLRSEWVSLKSECVFLQFEWVKDVLVKHGLAVPVLEELVQMLQQFDAAVELGKA